MRALSAKLMQIMWFAFFMAVLGMTTVCAKTAEELQALRSFCKTAIHIPLEEGAAPSDALSEVDRRAAFILSNEIRGSFPLTTSFRLAFAHDRDSYREPPRVALCPADDVPIIILNPKFAEDVRLAEPGGETFWKWLFVFYHELTHVLLRHAQEAPCNEATGDDAAFIRSVSREIEADLWSGFKLALLGASVEEATAALLAMHQLDQRDKQPPSPCYPDYPTRLKKTTEGWMQATRSSFITFGTPNSSRSFELSYDRDVHGYDLFSFPAMSMNHCAATCLADREARCGGFSYNKKNRFCYLKAAHDGDDKYRRFSSKDAILVYDIWSITGFPNDASNSPHAIITKPVEAPFPKSYAQECGLFELTDLGRELYAIPTKSIATKSREASVSRNQCRSLCRKEPACRAFYYDQEFCKFYDKIGSVRPSFHKEAQIHVKRFAADKNCKIKD